MTDVGVVTIGRNEGERLRRCIASISGRGTPIVYVDSGSTDGSVDMARSMGVDVIELDMTRPFSAARARNAGFERLSTMHPDLGFVMFMDGDCEIAPDWLDIARSEMDAKPDAAVICGRNREKFPEHSIYNRLADLEWDTPIGEAIACGGNALMRAVAFASVGGFDPTAMAGEEPELCQRLRAANWTIWRIDAEMASHDLAMTRFRQLWRRMYRCGYNGLDIQTRLPGKDQPFGHELSRSRLWGIHWPLALVIGTAAAWYAFGPAAGLATGLALLAIAPLRMLRIAAKTRHRVDGWATALAHGWFMVIGQFANVAGQFGYLIDRVRGKSGRLIEHKMAADFARPQATTHTS